MPDLGDAKLSRQLLLIRAAGSFLAVARWGMAIGALVAVMWYLRDIAVAATSGNTGTEALAVWLGQAKVSRFLAFFFGLCGVLYGLIQRSVRHSEVRRLEDRIAQLEAQVHSI